MVDGHHHLHRARTIGLGHLRRPGPGGGALDDGAADASKRWNPKCSASMPLPASRSPSSAPVLYATATTLFEQPARPAWPPSSSIWTAGALLLASVPAPKGPRPGSAEGGGQGRRERWGEGGWGSDLDQIAHAEWWSDGGGHRCYRRWADSRSRRLEEWQAQAAAARR